MKLVDTVGLPKAMFDAIANDGYSRGDADISVTQLISPPRIVELLRRYDSELTEEAADRVFSLIGQAIHTVLERASTDGLAEQRLYMEVNGWRISGQVDRMDGSVISDYKTASVNEMLFGVKPEREKQLNVYAHLARINGYEVTKLQAVFILRDWSKVRASKDRSYPQKQVVVVDLPLWSPLEAECYIRDRVTLHQQARTELPDCTPEERWAKPPVFAVKKPGRKSAVSLHEWETEAELKAGTIPGGWVERREGESLRCEMYCSAAPVCVQWTEIRNMMGTADDSSS